MVKEKFDRPTAPKTSGEDVVLVHSSTEDEKGYNVIRRRQETVEIGTIRPLQEGQPIQGSAVRLTPREESPVLFDVEVLHETQPETASRQGPAQVANHNYRRGWSQIFGPKKNTETNALN